MKTLAERYHQNARHYGQPWDQERTNRGFRPPDRPTSRDATKVLSNDDVERFVTNNDRRWAAMLAAVPKGGTP